MRCDLCVKKCAKGDPCETRDSGIEYDEEDRQLLKHSNAMNRETKGALNRVQETIEFAKRMGYKKIGLAFCVSHSEEAAVLAKILAPHFEINTVCCKTANMPDDIFDDVHKEGKVPASCNPAIQAKILGELGTEFNIVMGLCVGHDTIFYKHSVAPCTTLSVKDRVLANNPAAALTCPLIRNKLLPKPKPKQKQ